MYKRFCQIFIAFVCAGNLSAQTVDMSRTPYFNEAYAFANITLKSGRVFVKVKTRIDLVVQETYIITSNGLEVNIASGMVKEITYADTTVEKIIFYKFKTGFPGIDRQDRDNFYLVLAEGRCNLLKSVIKKPLERKDVLFGEVPKEYETFEEYYLFAKGAMKKLKKDKDFILAELSDKQLEVNQFIQSNKLNVKNNEHIVKLINYYNTL